jgi:D-alanine-D-alanine ligase
MHVLILHDALGADPRPDELDTLVQVEAVTAALTARGHRAERAACGPDLERVAAELRRRRPEVVFNLVESVLGQGRFLHLAPTLLESLGLPFTGVGADGMYLSSSKLLTKRVLAAAGIPTPDWRTAEQLRERTAVPAGSWLVKSVWEHGSLGLEASTVRRDPTAAALAREIEGRSAELGGQAFAECYVHGREFNVALLTGPDGPQVLPIPEIRFEGLRPEEPRIVGYRAKWATGSAEYDGTPRQFTVRPADEALYAELRRLALDTWRAFELDGAARVDFRVDEGGRPYVIDVNANPCLSPDAGYAAALAAADVPYGEALERILQAAVARTPRRAPPATPPARPTDAAPSTDGFTVRETVTAADGQKVRDLVQSTGFFSDEELDIAAELVRETVERGDAAGYSFVLLESGDELLAYSCYGRIPGTASSIDLYWIATRQDRRGQGLGRRVLDLTEARIAALGGTGIYVETSSRAQYEPTRAFYLRCGYREIARLDDFYAPGDGKVLYWRAPTVARIVQDRSQG